MIKQIEIKGFQAYKKKVVIKLSKGVNVVIGVSHTGKSSVVRSFKWCFQNRPQGDRFRHRLLGDKDPVNVGVIFSNDKKLSRIKSPSKNVYTISGQDDPFQALRTDVPEEVKSLSRMKDINIQGQHPSEQYFLLTESPGAVAKRFNEVSGLSIVDKTITSVNKRKRALLSSIKVYDQEIKESKEEITDTEWVPEALKEVKVLVALWEELEAQKKTVKIASELINQIEEIDEVLNTRYKHLDEILADFEELDEVKEELNKSLGIFQVLDGVLNSAIEAEKKINAYSDIDEALKELESIKKWRELNVSKLEVEQKNVETALINLEDAVRSLKTQEEAVVEAQITFDDLVETEECPTCGRIGGIK